MRNNISQNSQFLIETVKNKFRSPAFCDTRMPSTGYIKIHEKYIMKCIDQGIRGHQKQPERLEKQPSRITENENILIKIKKSEVG